jgi:alkylation response protein AidB-like acyl-CoA dehydrogenase
MDFRFTEEQTALQELAREILGKEVTTERLKETEARGDGFDRGTWARLAESNLLGLAIPEAQGGMAMGFQELCLLFGELGRAVAPVPALASLVFGGLPIARFGSTEQQQRWLAPLAKGEIVLSGAFSDVANPLPAIRDGDGWRLGGTLRQVRAAPLAERVLVPGRSEAGDALFLVDPNADGVDLERKQTSTRDPLFDLTLDATFVAAGDVLTGGDILAWTLDRALVAIAAAQVGVSERALEITTGFLTEREQFGAPLGALPPVQHRCADAYIALDALRWVTWQAAWKLSEERPASRDARVAKFWAAEAGSRIATATQHLHGGMGVDLDYPIHRYFLTAKSLELALGGATPQLVTLGSDMAATGPQETL